MDIKTIFKILSLENSITFTSAAEKIGKANASYVTNTYQRKTSPSLDTFLNIIDALGGEIIIKNKTSETQWKLNAPYKDK